MLESRDFLYISKIVEKSIIKIFLFRMIILIFKNLTFLVCKINYFYITLNFIIDEIYSICNLSINWYIIIIKYMFIPNLTFSESH